MLKRHKDSMAKTMSDEPDSHSETEAYLSESHNRMWEESKSLVQPEFHPMMDALRWYLDWKFELADVAVNSIHKALHDVPDMSAYKVGYMMEGLDEK